LRGEQQALAPALREIVLADAKARGDGTGDGPVSVEGPDKLGFITYVALKNGQHPKSLDTSKKEVRTEADADAAAQTGTAELKQCVRY
jgi:hypothetical protein